MNGIDGVFELLRPMVIKLSQLRCLLSQVSYIDQDAALRSLREWGEGRKPVTQMWEDLRKMLEIEGKAFTYVAAAREENEPKTLEDIFPIDRDIVHRRAYLPVKLAELSYIDQDAALRLLREWGAGKKPVSQLWDEAVELAGQAQLRDTF